MLSIFIVTSFIENFVASIYQSKRRPVPLSSRLNAILNKKELEKQSIAASSLHEKEKNFEIDYSRRIEMNNTVNLRAGKKVSIKHRNMRRVLDVSTGEVARST